jgi:hypothetical protein
MHSDFEIIFIFETRSIFQCNWKPRIGVGYLVANGSRWWYNLMVRMASGTSSIESVSGSNQVKSSVISAVLSDFPIRFDGKDGIGYPISKLFQKSELPNVNIISFCPTQIYHIKWLSLHVKFISDNFSNNAS